MNGLIAWFAKNSVAANLLLVLIVLGGLFTLGDLRQEIYPEISLDAVQVGVVYYGASPREVEAAICIPVEEALQGVEGIRKIASTARDGHGSTVLELQSGYDIARVLDDVSARVGTINTFPSETEKPIVQQASVSYQVINIAISGNADLATLKGLGKSVRDELLALPGISQAKLMNVPPYEISVNVSEESLRVWDLTFEEIAEAIRNFSIDLPGGSVRTPGGEVVLRTGGQLYTGEEYGQLPVHTRPDGTRVRLGEVATIEDGFEERANSSTFDGKPAVLLAVYRVGEESAIEVAEEVYRYVAEKMPSLPDGLRMDVWQDDARRLRGRLDLLVKNGWSGLVLVFVVLMLFLRIRLALWIAVGIAVSFLGAVALMPILGVSINLLSLFSFILVLGIVVDDAIVVGENIHAHQERTGKGTGAAIRGAQEVVVPVTFGVLTTMAAFVPMLFVSGLVGNLVRVYPLIVLPTLFFSLLESNLILPGHLSQSKQSNPSVGRNSFLAGLNRILNLFSTAMNWSIANLYRPLLVVALEWRYLTVSVALAIAMLTAGLVGSGRVRLIPLPLVESDNVVAFLTMRSGVPPEATLDAVGRIDRSTDELRRELLAEFGRDQFRHVLSSVGEQPFRQIQTGPTPDTDQFRGEHLGQVHVELAPSEDRDITAEEVALRWRGKVGQIAGAVDFTITYDEIGSGKAIDLQLSAADLEKLRQVTELTAERLAEYPGVVEVSDTYRSGKPEIQLALTREGEALGLTLQGLGRQVRHAFHGEEAQRIQRGRDSLRVMVRYPPEERRSLGDLERMRVRTPAGNQVPFSTVAVAQMALGPTSIKRVGQRRSVSVQAEVDESITTGKQVTDALESEFLPMLVGQYPGVTYSFEGDEASFAESFDDLARGFAAAVTAILALLALGLKSYVRPLIILSALPFGMVGAVVAHWALGMDLSIFSICGMAAVSGVVVNDALVMVTFIDGNTRRHGSLMEAARNAGESRFRPIILTSLTTSAGVTPLILEQSVQAQFLVPMALALASGVLFATAVTLVLVPVLYLILEDLRAARQSLAAGR